MQTLVMGKRADLLDLAWERIRRKPGRYVAHVYGEKEAGGTAWLYLSAVPFEKIDLPALGDRPPPSYTEPVQHAIFKWFLPPLSLYALLGGVMYLNQRKKRGKGDQA